MVSIYPCALAHHQTLLASTPHDMATMLTVGLAPGPDNTDNWGILMGGLTLDHMPLGHEGWTQVGGAVKCLSKQNRPS